MTPLSPHPTSTHPNQGLDDDYQDDFDQTTDKDKDKTPHKSPEKEKPKDKGSDKRSAWKASAAMTRASFMSNPDANNPDFNASARGSGGNSPARSKNNSMDKSPLGRWWINR